MRLQVLKIVEWSPKKLIKRMQAEKLASIEQLTQVTIS